MMRQLSLVIFCCTVLLVSGCDQTFAPKGEFHQQYVLQAFVQGDFGGLPTSMNALLARVYDVDGFDPSVNTNDPSVGGALVTFVLNARQDTLKERFRPNKDSLRYGPKQRYYSGRIVTPGPDATVLISARLPDGSVLSARTIIPSPRPIASSIDFPRGVTTRMSLPDNPHSWTIRWDSDAPPGRLFFPMLIIPYVKIIGDSTVSGAIQVPLTLNGGPDGGPVYPSSTFETECTFDFAALDWAMGQIAGEDPQKYSYGTHQLLFQLLEYDDALSKYYSSIHGSLDQFSIRIDQPVYSNIGGGIGIFGSYFDTKAYFDFDQRYVVLYGYRLR